MLLDLETKKIIENRNAVTFTPGINKRRLTRNQNSEITESAPKVKIASGLPEIRLNKTKTEEVKESKKEDPLMKF